MSVFNSLGSNYTPRFALGALFKIGKNSDAIKLCNLLEEQYDGSAMLTYKGRQALKEAVASLGLQPGAEVGINGFTCYVVWQAVVDAGCKPIFIDVAPRSLHFGVKELETIQKTHPTLKALIVQNTLGIACDMPAIEAFCRTRKMALIEDLAHSMGAQYADGREAGTVGNRVMLSFSQDKPLDAVAGGALILRGDTVKAESRQRPLAGRQQRFINRLYPLASSTIRLWYDIRVGAALHAGLKSLHLMATPMSGDSERTLRMSSDTAGLITSQWPLRERTLEHRKAITAIYREVIDSNVQISMQNNEVCLRFPLLVDEPRKLIAYLRSAHIYIGDTWYDAPIGPKKFMSKTNYETGMCPNAEYAAAHIVNLPTHINVSEKQAKQIAERVNTWLKSQ